MKFSIQNSNGFTHHLVLGFIVLAVAIGGTAYLVASHADNCSPAQSGVSGASETSGTSDPACGPGTSGTSGVSAPADGRKYRTTLLSQSGLGKVLGCVTGNTVYMRVVTVNATKLAYSVDGATPVNLSVPAHSDVYRHATVSGRTIATQLAKVGLTKVTTTPWAVAGINACN